MAKQNSPKVITKKHVARLERERRQINLIRGIALAGLLVVAGLLAFGYLRLNVFQLREPVAEVNGVTITTGEWQERVKFQRAQMLNAYNQYSFYQQNFGMDYSQQLQQILATLSSPEILGQQVLDQMTNEIIIRQEAEKRGLTVSAEEVESSIQETFGFFPNGTPSPTVTPTEFSFPTLTSQQLTIYPSTSTPTVTPTATVDMSATPGATATTAPATPTFVPEVATASPTPYTLEGFESEFDKTLDSFKQYNISERTIRSIYEIDLLRQKLVDEIAKDVPRTEEQVLARHILVETEIEAQAVLELLNQGVDFATVAEQHSKDTSSATRGGVLDWQPRSFFVTEFGDAAFTQEIGEIGAPVKSDFGYHIIQVIAREELPLSDVQYEQQKETAFNDWLTSAREAASITTYDVWKTRVPTEPALQQAAQ